MVLLLLITINNTNIYILFFVILYIKKYLKNVENNTKTLIIKICKTYYSLFIIISCIIIVINNFK